MSDIRKIIKDAIQSKEILLVTYDRKEGGTSEREFEPFDLGPNKNDPDGPDKLWGWCIFHNRVEGKFVDKIQDIKNTGKHFDPNTRPINWSFKIPRKW